MFKLLLLAIAACLLAVGVLVVGLAFGGAGPRDGTADLARTQVSDEVLGTLRDRAALGETTEPTTDPADGPQSTSEPTSSEGQGVSMSEAALRRKALIADRGAELEGLLPLLLGAQGTDAELRSASTRATRVSAMLLMDAAGEAVDLATLGEVSPPRAQQGEDRRLESDGFRYTFRVGDFPAYDLLRRLEFLHPAGIPAKELPLLKIVTLVNRARDAARLETSIKRRRSSL